VADKKGMTPLALAAKCGKVAVAKLLLEKGAELEKNKKSQSSLAQASRSGHEEMVRLLLAKGAMIEASALDAVAAGGHLKIFEILVIECPDIDRRIPCRTGTKIAYRCILKCTKEEIDVQKEPWKCCSYWVDEVTHAGGIIGEMS
jgi:Ankyrin repeats (3 copies)